MFETSQIIPIFFLSNNVLLRSEEAVMPWRGWQQLKKTKAQRQPKYSDFFFYCIKRFRSIRHPKKIAAKKSSFSVRKNLPNILPPRLPKSGAYCVYFFDDVVGDGILEKFRFVASFRTINNDIHEICIFNTARALYRKHRNKNNKKDVSQIAVQSCCYAKHYLFQRQNLQAFLIVLRLQMPPPLPPL